MTLPPRLCGRCSFHVFGVAGLVAAAAVTAAAVARSGLSLLVLALLLAVACVVFYALALITRGIAGEERLIYYHHEIAILLVLAAALSALGLPVAPYLDVAVLGLGAFLVFGRVGCAAVGCCFGRPAVWGWRYGAAHVRAGFPLALRGVPLVPVQLLEAAGVLAIMLTGGGLSVYLGGYAALRFALEFLRGDPARRRWRSWTEAQWTSIAMLGLVVWMYSPWLVIAPAIAAIAGLRERRWPAARHAVEIAAALREAPDVVRLTPLGLRLSHSRLPDGSRVYALSTVHGAMTEGEAARLLRMTALIDGGQPARIIRAGPGVTAMVQDRSGCGASPAAGRDRCQTQMS